MRSNKNVKALILTGFGLNCDMETAYAFETAGAMAVRVHINTLISGKADLDDFDILAFGGGFSWGDDHGAGVIQALKLKNHIGDKILSFIDKGKLVIGICNGFQTLVNLGLLPGIDGDYRSRSVALTWNDCGNFRDQWVKLSINTESPCVFTREVEGCNCSSGADAAGSGDVCREKFLQLELPVRHAQGKFVADPEVLDRLIKNNQIVLKYAASKAESAGSSCGCQKGQPLDLEPAMQRFPMNPNGSIHDIAGICDTTGHIFGLMPHPEAYNHFTNHPDWPKMNEMKKRAMRRSQAGERSESTGCEERSPDSQITPGMRIFMNGVHYIASKKR